MRALAYWVSAVLPGVPREALALLAVAAGWLLARGLGERLPVSLRLLLILAGAALGLFILAPQLG